VPTFCTHDHKYPTPEPFLLPWPPNLVQRWCRVRVRSIDIVLYNRQVDNRAEIEDPLWHQSHTLLNDTFETEDVPRTRDPDVSTLSKCHVGSVATQAHASQHACGRGMAGRGEPRWIEHDEPIRARRPDEALIIHLILARGGGECQHRHQLASATEARPPRALACYVCTCVCVCVCVCVRVRVCVCVCVSGMGCQVCMMHTLKPSARPSSPLVGRAGLGLRDTPNVAGVTTANAAPCNRPAIHTFIFIKTSCLSWQVASGREGGAGVEHLDLASVSMAVQHTTKAFHTAAAYHQARWRSSSKRECGLLSPRRTASGRPARRPVRWAAAATAPRG
jgi:hypothetical protein